MIQARCLLHAPMGIYYAYIDRCPVLIIGATGPMDEKYRRPFIDWIHTAFAQGDAVRSFQVNRFPVRDVGMEQRLQ